MSYHQLPPQAYTKETLAKAYSWLLSQSDSTKEVAKTPDVLVSLYLKSQRHGEEFLERPSVQNFKNDLKTLAGMMGEFEIPKQEPKLTEKTPETFQLEKSTLTPSTPASSLSNSSKPSTLNLDSTSLGFLKEVQEGFNLSSETEALRLLIALGYSKAKTILPSKT